MLFWGSLKLFFLFILNKSTRLEMWLNERENTRIKTDNDVWLIPICCGWAPSSEQIKSILMRIIKLSIKCVSTTVTRACTVCCHGDNPHRDYCHTNQPFHCHFLRVFVFCARFIALINGNASLICLLSCVIKRCL